MAPSNHLHREAIIPCLVGTVSLLSSASALICLPALQQPSFATSQGLTTRATGRNGDAIVGFDPFFHGPSRGSKLYKSTSRLHGKAPHAHGDEDRMAEWIGVNLQSRAESSNTRRWGVVRWTGTPRRPRCWSFKDWPSLATRATANANFDLGRDEANTGLRVDQDGHAPAVGSAFMSEGGGSSYAGGSSSLDRFLEMMTADDTKKLGAWLMFALVLSRLRFFYGVMLGTFVLSYMGNSVIELSMEKGNRALRRMGERMGWRRLPKKLPRPAYAAVYILLLLTAITSLSVVIVPRLTVESQALITKLSEQDNPYAIIASWPNPTAHATFLDEEQLRRRGHVTAGAVSAVCHRRPRQDFRGAMVSLLFSFMVIWDLPNLTRGMKALKTSRLAFAYKTISPQVSTFAKLVGQSFEVQFTIAAINTLLTTAGLIALGVSGPLVLSFIVFLCSFVPVVGVFISTLPMAVAALADYGMSKVLQILLMVFGVHAVEAYFLNPQIYASKLKLHPVVVIGVLYMAEHLVGVQGLIMAVPCAVFVINNIIMGNHANNSNGKAAHVQTV
eukprot:jgi/Undpi1/137/HiC_scaffold_1.g00137.m2